MKKTTKKAIADYLMDNLLNGESKENTMSREFLIAYFEGKAETMTLGPCYIQVTGGIKDDAWDEKAHISYQVDMGKAIKEKIDQPIKDLKDDYVSIKQGDNTFHIAKTKIFDKWNKGGDKTCD